ncbi:hypothetical protein PS706_05912 [Pseudomonas fluorescens]|nr:hypothetical protein PS706_05912 [Pseudomonas fluorescens]
MLAEQRDQGRRADNRQHEHQTLQARDLQATAKAADDGRDAHEAAVRVQRRDGDLAEGDAEVQQRSSGTRTTQAHDVGDFVTGELPVGHRRGKHAEDHCHLRANHRTRTRGEKGFQRGGVARQIA